MRSVMDVPTTGSQAPSRGARCRMSGGPRGTAGVRGRCDARARVLWRHADPSGRRAPGSCRGLVGETPTARRAKRNKPLRCRPLEGRRDQKSPFVVALSCVPRGERGSPVSPPAAGCCRGPVSPPGCRPEGIHPFDHRSFKTPGGCPAVDRMPTNRHAATGTCEIGQAGYTCGAPPVTREKRRQPPRNPRSFAVLLQKRRAASGAGFPSAGGGGISHGVDPAAPAPETGFSGPDFPPAPTRRGP